MEDSHAELPSYEERRRLEEEKMLKAGNKHPLNRRAAELLGRAGTTSSWIWIHALDLMFTRLYPPPDYYQVVAPDLENMRWGSNNYDCDQLEMKIHTMTSDWMPDKIIYFLTKCVGTCEPLLVADEPGDAMTIVEALNAAQTLEDGADILLHVLGEQMSDVPDNFEIPHTPNEIRAKATRVANRHPLNRCAREMLVQAKQIVWEHKLHALQLMQWRVYYEDDEKANRLFTFGSLVADLGVHTPLAQLRYLTVSTYDAEMVNIADDLDPEDLEWSADRLLEVIERRMTSYPSDKWYKWTTAFRDAR